VVIRKCYLRIELKRIICAKNATMNSNRSGTHIPERWTFSWRIVMITYTMIEPRSDRVTVCSPQTQHHCYQVIRTTRVHQSSRSSKMVTVQERVVRSRLQLGYSTPTSFINRYLSVIFISSKSNNLSNSMTDDRYQSTIFNWRFTEYIFRFSIRIFIYITYKTTDKGINLKVKN